MVRIVKAKDHVINHLLREYACIWLASSCKNLYFSSFEGLFSSWETQSTILS